MSVADMGQHIKSEVQTDVQAMDKYVSHYVSACLHSLHKVIGLSTHFPCELSYDFVSQHNFDHFDCFDKFDGVLHRYNNASCSEQVNMLL